MTSSTPARQPNIVLIMTDQQRWDALASADVFPVETPTLDRLSAEGMWFRRTYAQSPICVPSRMSFFTGRYPHQHGCLDNDTSVWPEAPSFVRSLRDSGYHTAAVGKLHYTWFHDLEIPVSGELLKRLGFDEAVETTGKMSQGNLRASAYSEHLRSKGLLPAYHQDLMARSEAGPLQAYARRPSMLDEDDHIDGWVLGRAEEWLHDVATDKPFFLWVGPPGPHDPFDPPAPWADRYRPEDMPLGPLSYRYPVESDAISAAVPDASPRQIQEMRTQYLANVSFIDDRVGRLVDVLQQRGLLADTWIVYCSDHGEMLGDHRLIWKGQLLDPAIRVPLVMRPPDNWHHPRGRSSDSLVELIDVPATLLDLAGAQLPGGQGLSLRPLLEDRTAGRPAVHRETVVAEFGTRVMVTDGRHKVITTNQAAALDKVFDLADDPDEERNLVSTDGADLPAVESLHSIARQLTASAPADLPTPWRHSTPYQRWGRNPLREPTVQ